MGIAKPGKAIGRPRETRWSKRLPGFGTRHYASGRRVYIVQAQMAGRVRTVTIGNAEVLTKAQALVLARRILLRAQTGENPAAEKAQRKAVPRFDRFLDEYWARVSPRWKPSTVKTHRMYRDNYIGRAFRGRFLDQIDQADVADWFASVARTGGPGAANRCHEIMRAVMNKAIEWGYLPSGVNPCVGIRTFKRQKCERFLSPDEIARLGKALKGYQSTAPAHCAAIALLLLTGCRKSEITDLRWSEVKGNRLRLVDSKTGPKTVWLGKEAETLLAERRKSRTGSLVFSGDGKPISLQYHWERIREIADIHDVRLHDLRHTFASHAVARAESLPMIGKLLGHARVDTTARYAHLEDGIAIHAAGKVGAAIEAMMR